jgi:DNA polymerase-3 subunit epsilon
MTSNVLHPTGMHPTGVQASFADLGTPLADVTFVVVDLETTGGAPADAGITEIGAVAVRGGVVLGEFATLVNPGMPIPSFVAALTGITDATVAKAPRLPAVLPSFLEFLGSGVLVAHNAPYDVSFLTGACSRHEFPWPAPRVIDTARLARVALHRDEVRNCKLATLAAHFRASVTPTHRALDDARATVDVLHALLERTAGFGVSTLEDLQGFLSRVTPTQRAKRHLADGLPDAPGVYVFEDAQGASLYVGTSRSIRTRVRSYFTASEQRRRMAEMVGIATRVTPIVCATTLEARVRELRLIVERQPRYNRRSRRPDRQQWVKLTVEPAPRLSIVRSVGADVALGARYLGPFAGRTAAEDVIEALLLAHPVRTCTTRIARNPTSSQPGCSLAELGRCLAPCASGSDRTAYDDRVAALREAMSGDLRAVDAAVRARMARLADDQRFEEAARWRGRLQALSRASHRTHQLAMIGREPLLVAAEPTDDLGWDIHVIRHGRLAAAGHARPGSDPRAHADALVAQAEHVDPAAEPAPAGLTEEALEILRWLESGDVRLVRATSGLALPIHGGGRAAAELDRVTRHVTPDPSGWLVSGRSTDRRADPSTARPEGPRATAVTRIRSA